MLWDWTYGFLSSSEKTRECLTICRGQIITKAALSSQLFKDPEFWFGRGLNPRPPAQQTGALASELTRHTIYLNSNNELIFPGLLETSKTVGQAVRALVQFPKPPDEALEIEAASDRGSKSGNQIEKEATGDEHAEQAEEITEGSGVATEQPSFSRHWFNTVLYGTPILVLNPPKGS